ncbi:hypothetical protein LAZ67_13003119 [Cordylochernes scorpioides]|uniref:CCHC-type domain-containing protein n=1 Tax=Cordylochernes scorpioides TaxID=51811 RepID=A0ABY6L7P8_9ARAC|nr:hypothetical protein LAZ67_13003119 [Cordylochernes scorpioides]
MVGRSRRLLLLLVTIGIGQRCKSTSDCPEDMCCRRYPKECVPPPKIGFLQKSNPTIEMRGKNLEQVFEPKSRSRILQLKKQFVNIKLQTGAEVDDQDIAYSMLSGLPDSFDTLVMSFGNVEDSDFTSNKVRNTLLTEYERRSAREGASSGLGEALNFSKDDTRKTSRKQGVKCYRCSKIGHIAKDCRSSINRDYKADKSYSRKKDSLNLRRRICSWPSMQSLRKMNSSWTAAQHITSLDTGTQDVTLNDVLFVPQARRNLLSVSQTEDKGKHIKICNHKARVFSDNRVICVARNLNGLYIVRGFLQKFNPTIDDNCKHQYNHTSDHCKHQYNYSSDHCKHQYNHTSDHCKHRYNYSRDNCKHQYNHSSDHCKHRYNHSSDHCKHRYNHSSAHCKHQYNHTSDNHQSNHSSNKH